jgi:hypothetical protein
LDEYLPADTLQWCREQLLSYGIDLSSLSAGDIEFPNEASGVRVHIRAYQLLRSLVRGHISTGSPPFLEEAVKPEGGYETVEEEGGLLSEVISANADFVRERDAIEVQFQGERDHVDLFDEGTLEPDWDI